MKKIVVSAMIIPLLIGCTVAQGVNGNAGLPGKAGESAQQGNPTAKQQNPIEQYLTTITEDELRTHLYTIASDQMQGRDTGSEGQKLAGRYLIEQYQKMGLSYPPGADSFYQPIASKYMRSAWSPKLPDSENIWTYIEGSDLKEEVVVISAHYDHVGTKNGEIYNGADDNASGTSALLEIADAFVQAKKQGHGPRRSILILHVTAEEYGLHGSRYYTLFPILPLENTIANVNIDMIGRRGKGMEDHDNYVYVIGSDRLSTDLHKLSEQANTYVNLDLDYRYNDINEPNRFYYRSDHYNFARQNIPAIFYFDGVHADYHKPTDTPDKIDYPLLAKRTRLAFSTAWHLANTDKRPVIDKDGK